MAGSVSPDQDPKMALPGHPDRRQALVAVLSGNDLNNFWDLMIKMSQPFGPRPVQVGFWVDPVDGGLKVKADHYSWSPAYGRVER